MLSLGVHFVCHYLLPLQPLHLVLFLHVVYSLSINQLQLLDTFLALFLLFAV